jgi:hydrogenase-1 operon protein HyaF
MTSESPVSATEASPLVLAILHELLTKLGELAASGRTATIDLRRLPLTAADRQQLSALLGQGEVIVEIQALGPSKITETRFPGVWWVDHKNAAGDTVGEAIEIALVPEILHATSSDAAASVEALVTLLTDFRTSSA